MANVKWIKLDCNMFDNRKIRYLLRREGGGSTVLLWVMLLTKAGQCNSEGRVFFTERLPYTPDMLADELGFEESTVVNALKAMEGLDMITTKDGFITITGWQEHQNIEGMEKMKEQNRVRKQRQRERERDAATTEQADTEEQPITVVQPDEIPTVTEPKSVTQQQRDCHANVTQCHATEEEVEEEREEEKEREEEVDTDREEDKDTHTVRPRVDYRGVTALYNELCPSLPRVNSLSDSRKKAIRARLKSYSMDDLKTLFEKAEGSSFLKGNNPSNWRATFDWLITDCNMAKVLDGNYDDRESIYQPPPPRKYTKADELNDFYKMATNWAKKKRAEQDEIDRQAAIQGETVTVEPSWEDFQQQQIEQQWLNQWDIKTQRGDY